MGTMTLPKMRRWAGEMAEQIRVLSILIKIRVWFSAPMSGSSRGSI